MTAEDAFVHSILNNPDDDTPRLVFADWLDEHDQESHAELIRVQCELARLPKRSRDAKEKARRAKLTASEKVLLRRPEFFPKWPAGTSTPSYDAFKRPYDVPKLEYERGFINRFRVLDNEVTAPSWAKSPWNTLLREGKALAVELHPEQGGFTSVDKYADRFNEELPQWMLQPQGEATPEQIQAMESIGLYEMANLAKHPVLCRVVKLYTFEDHLTKDNLGVLARSPLLTQLRDVWLLDCTISLDAFRELVTSPSITQLRELLVAPVDVPEIKRGNGGQQLWELVATSPNMATLERVWIDSLDNKAAEALLKSPYLKPTLQVCSPGDRCQVWAKRSPPHGLNAANVKALRQRYPGPTVWRS